MNDYHIRELDDGTWVVSCQEESKKGMMGKMIEYAYDDLEDALEDIKSGFSGKKEEPEEDENPMKEKATAKMKKMMRGDDE